MAELVVQGTTNTEAKPLDLGADRNTYVWWALLLVSIWLAIQVTPWGSLFWLVALLANDAILFFFGKAVLFDSQLRIRRGYQWMHHLYDNTTGSGRDLGFNLVVDGALSQRAKFEHMVEELGLTRGMVVCDVGCGYGDWLKYCRDVVGCETVGINLTPEQAIFARSTYGLEVHVINWKEILNSPEWQSRLYGRFDAVTFMDTVEHYVSMEDRNDREKQDRIYSAMFQLTRNLLKRDSSSKRVFLSCLHQTRRPRTWGFYFHSYLMDKFYSGHYPFLDEGPREQSGSWFDTLKVEDRTEDYRLTGVLDRKHFQAVRITWTLRKVVFAAGMLLLDPYVLHRLLYYTQDSWMYFYGERAYSLDYDPGFRKRVSYVALLWITLQLKPDRSSAPEIHDTAHKAGSSECP